MADIILMVLGFGGMIWGIRSLKRLLQMDRMASAVIGR